MNYVERFKVQPGTEVKLKDIEPSFKDRHDGHKEAAEEIEHYQKKLRELQELLYADGRCSLLICLQAMDSGGKDGTINHVLGAMNPQGCRVVAFKQPSTRELCTISCGGFMPPRRHEEKWRFSIAPTTKTC